MNCLASSALSRVRDHPAGDVAAEDIEDDVQIEVGPLDRTPQLGDVPAPKLVGRGGQQLRLLVSRMNELIAALARFSLLFQDAVHGAGRAEVLAFVQQGGLHGCRRAVLESLFMEDGQHAARSAGLSERAGADRSGGKAGSGAGDADGPKTGRCR